MFRRVFERLTGYWTYKARYLPIGADLRIDLARNGLTDPATIFDVGANVGQTYARFRREFPKARIYCFEPVQRTFEQLALATAGDPLAIAEQIALGDRAGQKRIRTNAVMSDLNTLRDDLMSGNDSEVVTIETVDDYVRRASVDRVDILKVDTEGYEIPVLQGADESLANGSVRTIFAEVGFERHNRRNTSLVELTELLLKKGFHFYGLYDVRHFPNETPPSFGNALFVR